MEYVDLYYHFGRARHEQLDFAFQVRERCISESYLGSGNQALLVKEKIMSSIIQIPFKY